MSIRYKRWGRRVALAVFGPLMLYLVAATFGALIPGTRAELPTGQDIEIKLIAGPIHYDFLLPANEETRAAMGFAQAGGVPVAHPAVSWLLVGWGAERFYTTTGGYRDLSVGAIWRGVVGDRSVLRVDVVGPLPADLPVSTIALSRAQYRALLARIVASRSAAAGRWNIPVSPRPTRSLQATSGSICCAPVMSGCQRSCARRASRRAPGHPHPTRFA